MTRINQTHLVAVSVILLSLRIQLNHGINAHDGNAGLDGALELLDLAHAGLQHAGLEAVVDASLHQVEAVVPIGLLLGDFFLGLVGIAFLYALRDRMADSQLGNELGGVFGCVDGQRLGSDKERLGKFANGELLAGAL
jgi:hypothetical protein